MSRFLFITWWGGGNVTPVRVLSGRLTAAGHEVTVLGPARLRAECEAVGARYVEQSGGFTASPDDLTALLDADPPPDAVVVDAMLPELLATAEASGRPWGPLVHTLAASVLTGAHSTITAFASLETVNERRLALGLSPAADDAELLTTAPMILVAGPAAVDRRHDVVDVRYLGSMVEQPDGDWTPPGRPLVVVGLGTTPMDELPVLERVLEALGGIDASVFATVGDHLEPASVAAPPNATVSPFVRHSAVLPHADVVVCHAGLGTITNALTFGVPVLCVPLGRDQHDNAARVVELGGGLTIAADAPASDLAAAVRRLLEERHFADAARAVADRIAAEARTTDAVDVLVELAGG